MTELNLENANRALLAALAKGKELALPPLAVAVLDAGGYLIAFQREDGASFGRVAVSHAKAFGALALGVDTARISERYEQRTREAGFINALNALTGGQVIPLPGGLLIKDDSGRTLGAIGVSGAVSEKDEECAAAGIAAIA